MLITTEQLQISIDKATVALLDPTLSKQAHLKLLQSRVILSGEVLKRYFDAYNTIKGTV
jgi:hypothetical protein